MTHTIKLIIWTAVASLAILVSLLVLDRSFGQTAHPCDTTPPSLQFVQIGQQFTFAWCHPQTGAQEYHVYRNGVEYAVVPLSTTAPNATGLYYASIIRTETTAGTVSWEVAAVYEGLEGPRGGPLSLEVVVAPVDRVAPTRLRAVL